MTRDKFLEIIDYIGNIIKKSPFEGHVYAVGGSVRDYVMGLTEIKDIDLVIDLPDGGIKFAEYVRDNLGLTKTVVTYQTYGTAMFHFFKYPEYEIECVMTRKEQYKDKDSRNPETEFGTIIEDSVRRDLTINALYMRVDDKEIKDPTTKGMDDMRNKLLRVTNDNPHVVFSEDPLRIVRVVRFLCRFSGFKIDELTYQAMKDDVDRLSIIKKERIRDELEKILQTYYSTTGIMMLHEIGAMKYIIPEFDECFGLEQNKYHFGDVASHTLALISQYNYDFGDGNIVCLLACLLHDIGKVKSKTIGEDGRVHFYDHETVGVDMVDNILRRLKYDNDTINEVKFIVRNHMMTKQWGDFCGNLKKEKKLNKFIYRCGTPERFENLIRVIECDNLAHHPDHCICGQYEYLKEFKTSKFLGYKLPITGDDVMDILGIEPGPMVKKVLDQVLNRVLAHPNYDRDCCLNQVKGVYKQILQQEHIK